MALSLKSLRERAATVTLEVYGEELIITYDPTKFTPEFRSSWFAKAADLDRLNEATRTEAHEAGEPFDQTVVYRSNAELMLDLITGWNLLGMDDKPLPVTIEAVIEQMPEVLIQRITNAVWADVRSMGKPTNSGNLRSLSA